MLRVHRRDRTLVHVLSELRRYRDELGIDVRVHCLQDRPTDRVREVLANFKDLIVGIDDAPVPLVGERLGFCEAARFQFDRIRGLNPDWVLFQDDDRWLEPSGANVDLGCLDDPNLDLVYAASLFIWDHPNRFNPSRSHCSPIFFRYRSWDQFPIDRELQAPLPLHDEAIVRGRTAVLTTPLLDYGSFTPEERAHLSRVFLAAGKDDDYIRALTKPALLSRVTELLGTWTDLWSGVIRRPNGKTEPLSTLLPHG